MKSEGKQKDLKYAILQLVMAKIRGYASWPALILAKNSDAKKPYYVIFIADRSFAYLQENQMQPFTEKSVEDSTDIKNRGLQTALSYAMKLYTQEMTVEQYLEAYPGLLTQKDQTLGDIAKETKQKIEEILAHYRVSGLLEYTIDQIIALDESLKVGAASAKHENMMQMIERKISSLLEYEKIKEKISECAYSNPKVLEILNEFKTRLESVQKPGLASKTEKLITILS